MLIFTNQKRRGFLASKRRSLHHKNSENPLLNSIRLNTTYPRSLVLSSTPFSGYFVTRMAITASFLKNLWIDLLVGDAPAARRRVPWGTTKEWGTNELVGAASSPANANQGTMLSPWFFICL